MPNYTDEDDALLDELGIEAEAKTVSSRTPREERIVSGFDEIQKFVEQNGRAPMHGDDRDIFERLYAVRLDRLRELNEYRHLLEPLDHQGLLAQRSATSHEGADDLDDEALLAELGIDAGPADITDLRHVRSAGEKKAADEIANRQSCYDFGQFETLFEQAQIEIASGLRQTRRFERKSEIAPGRLYILGGQKAYVASMEEAFTNEQGKTDARLRVIFDNGTESNLLLRSLQRALQQDPTGRRIVEVTAGPLFADRNEAGDEASGIVYVLRSQSNHPIVAENREVLHKIGVTSGDVARRVASARMDPTFLMADVEIVATYPLYNVNRTKLENLIHRIFGAARLAIEIKDRFGQPTTPREWFLVPLFAIDEAIDKIRSGTITDHVYDPKTVSFIRAESSR